MPARHSGKSGEIDSGCSAEFVNRWCVCNHADSTTDRAICKLPWWRRGSTTWIMFLAFQAWVET